MAGLSGTEADASSLLGRRHRDESQAFLTRDEYITFWVPPEQGGGQNDDLDALHAFSLGILTNSGAKRLL